MKRKPPRPQRLKIPEYHIEHLDPAVIRFFTDGNPKLTAVGLWWPEKVRTLIVYDVTPGLTPELLEVHYARFVAPILRQRLADAQPLGAVQ